MATRIVVELSPELGRMLAEVIERTGQTPEQFAEEAVRGQLERLGNGHEQAQGERDSSELPGLRDRPLLRRFIGVAEAAEFEAADIDDWLQKNWHPE